MAKSAPRPRVVVPTAAEDRLRVGRVGVVAVVGFVIGVAWPALAGKSLVPSAPRAGEELPAATSSGGGEAPAAPAQAPATSEPAAPEPATTEQQLVVVGEATVTSCRNSGGQRVTDCDAIDLDEPAKARIAALASCDAAKGVAGTLSLGFDLDFSTNRIAKIHSGKSTSIAEGTARALVACAEKEFASASIANIAHRHSQYTVFYSAKFVPPGEVPPSAESGDGGVGADTPASGLVTVAWDVALVRDSPKDGALVARVLHGTRVAVKARRGDWYRISYDSKGNEGWVYRAAIGL